jgi:hypothetical protein
VARAGFGSHAWRFGWFGGPAATAKLARKLLFIARIAPVRKERRLRLRRPQ